MTRLKVHHLLEAGLPHTAIAERCAISLRSVERIAREPAPTRVAIASGELPDRPRRGRPSKADEALVAWLRAELEAEPHMMATEALRRARERGYRGGRSAMSELVRGLRPVPSKEPLVRFDGLPGEYAQFDFGEARLRFRDGRVQRVVFFAARLKHSRLMHVALVPDQTAETLARAVVRSLDAFGGSPQAWVFDNPKTVRISPIGERPVRLHAYLRDLVADYNVIVELCAPASGNQKGSVERLVGYVKKSFLFARRFDDVADVSAQLQQWLSEVNDERPCDATGVIPRVALQDELPFLRRRPLLVSAANHALRETRTVGADGTVSFAGTTYFASARRIGAAATLLVREQEMELVVGDQRSVHVRRDRARTVQRLPEQREQMLEVVHGTRKRATFRRQCLLELGSEARAVLTHLVHGLPDGRWQEPCSELYDLLVVHGDDAMRQAFARCLAAEAFSVKAIAAAVRRAA